MNRKQSFVLSGGAFVLGLAFAWAFYTPRTYAASPLQPLIQSEGDTEICPLSDKQQEESIQKFSAMMPTFTHPRCINCHGAMNPFAANTKHVGGRIGPKFKEIVAHDNVLGKDVKLVVPDVEDPDVFLKRCQDCHSAFTGSSGWSIPPVNVYFAGKDPVQLCQQMKRAFGGELQQFADHLANDELGFIQEGFRGTRGLDENGQATYLNETGNEFKPEPPPIAQAAFVEQGKAWLAAMGYHGEGVKAGPTCGCEPHHYVLKGSFDEIWTKQEGPLHFTGHAELRIPIQFNDDGSFDGQTTIDVAEANSYTASVMSCSEKISYSGVTWKAKGSVDARGGMQLTISVQFPASEIKSVCTAGGVTTSDSLPNIRPEQNMEFSDFVEVGSPFTVEDPYPQGGSLKAQFTIMEEKQ